MELTEDQDKLGNMYRSRKDWETLVKEDDMDVVLPRIKHLLSLCLKRGSADADKLVAGLKDFINEAGHTV